MTRLPPQLGRRTFLGQAGVACAALTGLDGALRGALRDMRASLVPAPQDPRPFTMLSLGDSVMWGQGLAPASKFTTQVRDWVAGQTGRPVTLHNYSRSGASILPDKSLKKVEPWMNDRSLGEVPCRWPYITEQVKIAAADLAAQGIAPESVEFVLLDGGINDVGVTRILSIDPAVGAAEIATDAQRVTGPAMRRLLDDAKARFPTAKILVTGYFQIASAESNFFAIAQLIEALTSTATGVMGAPAGGAGLVLTPFLQAKLIAQSEAWYTESTRVLGEAVAAARGATHPTFGTVRVAFAPIPWLPSHCYAAGDTRLWQVGPPADEVYDARQAACWSTGQLGPTCRDAKMGHPNPAGARAYTAACIARLAQYVPEWRGLRALAACVEMYPPPVAGSQTTITVHAVDKLDPATRIAGTARIGATTFATGVPRAVTLCRSGAGGGCDPIVVSAPGYADLTISSYWPASGS
jgi:hypothetical protein